MDTQPHPLKAYRERAGKSLDWLADELTKRGMTTSKATLSRVENHKQTLNPELLPLLKELVEMPPDEGRPDLARLLSGASE